MVLDAGANVTIDGDGLITISGEELRQIFIVSTGASLNNIRLRDGN